MRAQCGRWISGICLAIALGLAAAAARGEIPRVEPKLGDTLEAVLERIQTHSEGEAWKQGDFKDEIVEGWVDRLVEKVARAAAFPDLAAPVHFKDVSPGKLPGPGPAGLAAGIAMAMPKLQGVLFIGNDFAQRNLRLENSIVLSNGNVEVSHAENCVIIARGVVKIDVSSTSVIVAGAQIKLAGFDGQPRNMANGSLLVSRGWVEMRSGYGTLVYAVEGANTDRMENITLINATVPEPEPRPAGLPARESVAKSLKVPDLSLERIPEHPLASRITMLGIVHGEFPEQVGRMAFGIRERYGARGILFRFNEQKQVAELDAAIVDDAGAPIEQLRDWKLVSLHPKFALLTKPGATAVLRLVKKQAVQP